jgi:hypothetical protein
VEEIEVKPDTLHDVGFAHKISRDLNKYLLWIPGDRAIVILNDFEEEEEGADLVLTKVPPHSAPGSQDVVTFSSFDEEDKEEKEGRVDGSPFPRSSQEKTEQGHCTSVKKGCSGSPKKGHNTKITLTRVQSLGLLMSEAFFRHLGWHKE